LEQSTDNIINRLVEILRTKGNTSVRLEAARSLAKIGEPAAAITIPVLLKECANYAYRDIYIEDKMRTDLILLFGNSAIKPAIDLSKEDKSFWYVRSLFFILPEIPQEYLSLLISEFEKQNNDLGILQLIAKMSYPCPEAVSFLKGIMTSTKFDKYSSQREYAAKSLAKLSSK